MTETVLLTATCGGSPLGAIHFHTKGTLSLHLEVRNYFSITTYNKRTKLKTSYIPDRQPYENRPGINEWMTKLELKH